MDKVPKYYKFPNMMIDMTPDSPGNNGQDNNNNNNDDHSRDNNTRRHNGHDDRGHDDSGQNLHQHLAQPHTDNIINISSARHNPEQARKASAQPSEALINLPSMTKILLAMIIIPHLAISLILSPPQQYWIMEHFGFIPSSYTLTFTGWPAIIGPFTHMFLHASWLHLGMNAAMLIAFGAGLERWMGGKRLFLFFYICALAGAVFHFIIAPTSPYIMIGASGGISGLFGAVMVMLSRQGRIPLGKYGLWPLIIFWVILSLIFGVIGAPDGSNIAWAAHIGGFLFGLLMITPFMAYGHK